MKLAPDSYKVCADCSARMFYNRHDKTWQCSECGGTTAVYKKKVAR